MLPDRPKHPNDIRPLPKRLHDPEPSLLSELAISPRAGCSGLFFGLCSSPCSPRPVFGGHGAGEAGFGWWSVPRNEISARHRRAPLLVPRAPDCLGLSASALSEVMAPKGIEARIGRAFNSPQRSEDYWDACSDTPPRPCKGRLTGPALPADPVPASRAPPGGARPARSCGMRRCQRAAESPQFGARKIPQFGGVGDQPLA